MKCKNCKEIIEECANCNNPFEEGDDIICMLDGDHFCDLDCFFEKFEQQGDGCKSECIKGGRK